MERSDVEQLLDFATRDWPADWRGNFAGDTEAVGKGADFVTLYLYVHRVRDCERGVYRWDGSSCSLEQRHHANVERVAAYLSLEQALAGNACFAVSMIADLAKAAAAIRESGLPVCAFRSRGHRAEAVPRCGSNGLERHWHRCILRRRCAPLPRLPGRSRDPPVGASLHAAEQSALVMLGSPSSRSAATQTARAAQEDSSDRGPVTSPSRVNQAETALPADSSQLPRQVIYHFAVGRAILDLRIEA